MNGSHTGQPAVPRTRVRTGCITCRTRKVKCDEQKPQCGNCLRLKKTCIYRDGAAARTKSKDFSTSGVVVTAQAPGSDIGTSPASDRNPLQQTIAAQNRSSRSASSQALTDDSSIHEDYLHPQSMALTFHDHMFDHWDPTISTADPFNHFLPTYDTPSATFHVNLEPDSHGDLLFPYFREHVNPPYLKSFDSIAWSRIRNHIVHLGTQNEVVASAIVALEVLHKAESANEDVGVGMTHYYTAKSSHRKMVETAEDDHDTLLVATFLLCCFEMIAPSEAISITLQSEGPFVKKLQRRVRAWSPVSRRLISWLIVFHGKAMHLGGRGILSRRVHQLLVADSDLTSDLGLNDPADPEEIICETMSSLLYKFHMDTQKISPLIAGLDRHHRTRDSPEDELAAQMDADRIRLMLQDLWIRRPRIFDLGLEAFTGTLSQRVTAYLTDLIRTFRSNFLGEVIYLGRARADTPQANLESQEAMASLRTIIGDGSVHDGLFWPLFMYALETLDVEEVRWAVGRLRSADDPISHSGAIANLAEQLAQAQLMKGERIDTRYFSIETLGGPPPFI